MNNNYSPDPKNVSPVSNISMPQSGLAGNDAVLSPQAASSGLVPSTNEGKSVSVSSSSMSPDSGNSGGRRRLSPGTSLSEGRYLIEKLVAAGGMGAVYRAIDKRFNRPCAVKEMLDEFNNDAERAQSVEWFSREATMLLDLNHPSIPRVRDFFLDGGRHYLVMDFIEGRTLGEILEKEGLVPGVNGARGVLEARARNWAQQVCNVLSYLHRQVPPIIFRDLKPSNIMVTGNDEVKLIDFGIARTFQSQHQSTVIMTVGYAPPEQLYGMPEPGSDIYSLGATLHRVLTAHDAANNKPTIFSFPPLRALRPDISPAFELVVMKALAPDLKLRWSSCVEMERAIINLPPITVVPSLMPSVAPISAPVAPVFAPSMGGALTPGTPGASSAAPEQPSTGGGVNAPVGSGPVYPGNTPAVVGPATGRTTGPAGAHLVAALGHLAAGRIEAAYTEVTQAHALEQENSLVHRIFGQVFARRVPPQVDLAIRAYNHSLQLNPNDAETHKLLGDIWLFLRPQPAQSIPAYIQSIKLNPKDAESHFRLGQCYEKTGQLDAALREYQEALQLVPKQPVQPALSFAMMLSQLAQRMKQYPIAELALVQALTLDPAAHTTRFQLCRVYEIENKLEDAFRECSYVIGPLGANPEVQQAYTRLRTRLGR
jgi:serine/threonine protein kinase/Tfp pilus assembly protein PilF